MDASNIVTDTFIYKEKRTMNKIAYGYLGNELVKPTGVKIEWSAGMIREYQRCSQDSVYFIETYVKIITEAGLVPFKLRDYQRDMILSFQANRFSITCQARQSGKSEAVRAFLLWYANFHSEKTSAILSNKAETSQEILTKLQISYQNLPNWLKGGVTVFNKRSMVLENGSRIIASSTSSTAVRGYTLQIIFVDECAHIDQWDRFWASVYPTISAGMQSKVILASTPKGLNHFYKFYIDAVHGKNDFHPFFVTWKDVPGRDEAWRKTTLAGMNGNQQQFAAEMDCEFLGSSGTLISGACLKRLVDEDPIAQSEGFSQFKLREPGHRYCLMADVSHGKGLDYSAFHVIDVTSLPYQQAGVYRSNSVTPTDYAEVIHRLATFYNNAAILIEVNDIGAVVAETLQWEFGDENILYTSSKGAAAQAKQISFQYNGGKTDKGLRTNKQTKSIGCSILKLLIEQDTLILNDYHTISELTTFSKQGASYEAEPGCHDDLVSGLLLFAWFSDQKYFKELTDTNAIMAMRDRTSEETGNALLPMVYIDTGHAADENVGKPTFDYHMFHFKEDPGFIGELDDIRGLLK